MRGFMRSPPAGNCWKVIYSEYEKLVASNRAYFGKDGNGVPRRKEFLSLAKGLVPWTWWPHEECGHTDEAKKEVNKIFGGDISFATPKPERLIERILHVASNTGDLVLDSFLGSGTTAAVAHKTGRHYIGIEMGDHAVTHCAPRLRKDIEGGITPVIRFPRLAAHIWFSETHTALHKKARSPFLGRQNGTAYYLLYNGILGDKRPNGGNVLT